ncbi:hypothetical protein [Salinibacter altiplanensis]|uniref:hypothetical protein n=1 Tax=Salinibacter altiplanensis TaxID=1803181 RepID=UPI000C9F9604|nr:hypothetical protein [Salinibacter altiplanensis]
MLHRRSVTVALSLVFSLLLGAVPASAQSVASVVSDMQSVYDRQMETVDTYIVETNLYTSYHQKDMGDDGPTYRTQTRLKGTDASSFAANTTPSAAYGLQFDRLKQHATYAGTEAIDGVRCHILQVDNPSAVNPNVEENATSMAYYIDAERHVPARMVVETAASDSQEANPSSVTVRFKRYETTDGLTLPHRMEIQLNANISDKQRQQMQQMMEKMEQLPEQQRKQMEQMMGDQMNMMKQIMSGDPIAIEVQSVQVNVELPGDVF